MTLVTQEVVVGQGAGDIVGRLARHMLFAGEMSVSHNQFNLEKSALFTEQTQLINSKSLIETAQHSERTTLKGRTSFAGRFYLTEQNKFSENTTLHNEQKLQKANMKGKNAKSKRTRQRRRERQRR